MAIRESEIIYFFRSVREGKPRAANMWLLFPLGSDLRTRAIAKIFGMTQVDWNNDTDDWEIPEGKNTEAAVAQNFQKWLTGPKSPGLSA